MKNDQQIFLEIWKMVTDDFPMSIPNTGYLWNCFARKSTGLKMISENWLRTKCVRAVNDGLMTKSGGPNPKMYSVKDVK